jgi:hypothetical protein
MRELLRVSSMSYEQSDRRSYFKMSVRRLWRWSTTSATSAQSLNRLPDKLSVCTPGGYRPVLAPNIGPPTNLSDGP